MDLSNVSVAELLLAFVAAMGIPSAIMGFVVWKLERRISQKEKESEEREAAREKLLVLIVQSSAGAIALGEATAKAVQRIPDAHCNGDMHDALEYATSIKHKQKEFLTTQGIQALWD